MNGLTARFCNVSIVVGLVLTGCSSKNDIGTERAASISGKSAVPAGGKSVIMVPMPKAKGWQDHAYLAAIPAATRLNNGRPVVLAVDPYATLRPETLDFLKRYKPDRTYILGDVAKANQPSEGLAGYWQLNEGTGLGFKDSTGTYTGQLHRLPAWKTNKAGGYAFNGQAVDVVRGSAPGSSPELTVAFWVKADKVKHQVAIGKTSWRGNDPGWAVLLRDGKERNAVRFRIGSGPRGWHNSDLAVDDAYKANDWVHIACTFADGVSKVYLNGKLKGTRKDITWSTPNNTTNPLRIGSNRWPPLVGLMDELRIYDRALGPMEIERLLGAAGPTKRGLVGYWPMDEKDGGLARNRAGDTNLQLYGKATWVKGRVGGAVRLNGQKDGLQSPTTSAGPMTVTFRLKSNGSQDSCILSKIGLADGLPPWSFHVAKKTLIFRIGDKNAELQAADACKPGRSMRVAATYKAGIMALWVDGKVVASKKQARWQAADPPLLTHRFHGTVDGVRLYNRALVDPSKESGEGLVGSWDLDDESNRSAVTCWTKAQVGDGLLFDGKYVYADCPAPAWNSDELTVSFWMKPTKAGCVMNRFSGNSANPGWSISLLKYRQSLQFEVDGQRTSIRHAESYRPGQWTHVTCTYAKGVSTIYLDGRLAQIRQGIKQPKLKGQAELLRIGSRLPGKDHFAGALDDVRMYNRALSETEALALFASVPAKRDFEAIPADSAEAAANAIAQTFWKTSDRLVCCSADNYGDALVASALAARLRVPLIFFSKNGYSSATKATIKALQTKSAILIGTNPPVPSGLAATALADDLAVLKWMKISKIPVDYLAAVNPQDRRIGQVCKTSLAGPLLAAGRNGAVAILDFDTQWKLPFSGVKTVKKRVANAPDSKMGWRTGQVKLNGESYPFVLSSTKGKVFDRVSIDTGAGRYNGPFRTADRVKLGDRFYTVNMGPKDGIGKAEFRLTWPGADKIQSRLNVHYKTMGRHPEYLCILGRPDAIPHAIILKWPHIEEDIPSDLPFAQADEDPFSEIAVGRFVAEDVYSATLLGCRGLVYNDLLDHSWTSRCASACWESLMDPTFQNMGYGPSFHHDGRILLNESSPLRNVAAISHAEHSSWIGLGGFVDWQSAVLLAPAVIETSGCSTMSLDIDPFGRSAPVRLLRNGAVTVSGNMRLGIGQQEHYRTEFWNGVTRRMSVGQAHRYALNRVRLAVLEKKQLNGGSDRYQLFNRVLYGDPAVTMYIPKAPKVAPARVKTNGNDVTVFAPGKWWRSEEFVVPDWRYTKTPKLYAFRGAGVGAETQWHHRDHYDFDTSYFVAEVRIKSAITKVEQIDKVASPLGWTNQFWTDMHQDGSRSILWRVRLIDFDKPTGKIRSQVDKLQYKLFP